MSPPASCMSIGARISQIPSMIILLPPTLASSSGHLQAAEFMHNLGLWYVMRKLIDLLFIFARILVDRWHVNKFSCVLSSYLVPAG